MWKYKGLGEQEMLDELFEISVDSDNENDEND